MPIARAKDTNKDQTYFIWQIKKEQIQKILFPVGEFENKELVREYAHSKGLITSSKPDSQGLCFVGQTSLREMLLSVLGRKVGDIIVELNEEQIVEIELKVTKRNTISNNNGIKKIRLGQHDGAFLFTIGQRQNLGLSNGPWLVSDVDVLNNEVIVCHSLYSESIELKSITVSRINWQVDFESVQSLVYTKSNGKLTIELESQIRYRNQAQKSTFEYNIKSNYGVLTFEKPIKAIAKGQSVVFYSGQILLGGGVIEEIIK